MSPRLTDLNPHLLGTLEDGGVLIFDCPLAPPNGHKIQINVRRAGGPQYWQASGEFPDTLSLVSSIQELHRDPETGATVRYCWHGYVTNGDVTSC